MYCDSLNWTLHGVAVLLLIDCHIDGLQKCDRCIGSSVLVVVLTGTQRDRTTLCIVEYFTKLLQVTQDHLKTEVTPLSRAYVSIVPLNSWVRVSY